jgi:predicted PurR-regulated permease PerM
LTAEGLRRQLHVWIRDSLSDVGSRSLGMAGGTFNILSGSVVAIGSALLAFVIFAVSLYYFLADGIELIRATERLIPVHVEYQRQMLQQFARVVRAVVMATFFAALAQSVATVAALAVLGFGNLFVIFLAALLMSMIPMLGTWLVWLPCAGYLLYEDHPFQALFLVIYGAAFIGMLDNVVRTYILNTDVKLHPLLALISVLGGLRVMGLWGMFVGPIVASCLHALVKIFNLELAALSKEKFAGIEGLEHAPLPQDSPPPVMPTPEPAPVAEDALPLENGPADIESETPSTAHS